MKYHYKTPEQVQKEIQEYIKQNKTTPNKKNFNFFIYEYFDFGNSDFNPR
jgi:hypothetical protein